MSASLIERVRERLAAESSPLHPTVVAAAIRAESGGVLGDTEVLTNLRVLQTELTGAGPLEPLLCAPGTTDVLVTAPDAVWVDDGAGLRRAPIRFPDEAAVRRLAQRLALAAGRRLDEAQPWVDGQLHDVGTGEFTVRLHAVLPPVATAGTCLSLRVLRPASQDLPALVAAGTLTEQAAALLRDIVDARLSFLVSGGTGAGNTTANLWHPKMLRLGGQNAAYARPVRDCETVDSELRLLAAVRRLLTEQGAPTPSIAVIDDLLDERMATTAQTRRVTATACLPGPAP